MLFTWRSGCSRAHSEEERLPSLQVMRYRIEGISGSFVPFAVLLVVDRHEDYRYTDDYEYEPAVLECVQPAPDEEYHESDHSDYGDVGFQCHSVSLLEVCHVKTSPTDKCLHSAEDGRSLSEDTRIDLSV